MVGSKSMEYVAEYTTGFKHSFTAAGGEMVGEDSVQIGQKSYSSAVNKLKAAQGKYDVIFTPLFVPDVVTFLTELRAAGIKTPVLLGDGADTPLLFSAGDPGEIFLSSWGVSEDNPKLEAFNEAFTEAHGKAPESGNPAIGASIIDVIEAAVTKAQSTDSVAVRDAIAELQDVQTATGPISYKGAPYGAGLQMHPSAILTANERGNGFDYEKTVAADPKIVAKP